MNLRRTHALLLVLAACLATGGWATARAASAANADANASTAAPAGLAEKYATDSGLAKDPAVVLYEDFENEAGVFDGKRWTEVSGRKTGALSLTRDAANVCGGSAALQIRATLGKDTGGHLFTRFGRGYDRLHLRYCVKFAEDCDYIHHFVHMAAELPATRWPTGGAGLRPDGAKKFTVALEPWGKWKKYPVPGAWHFYNYWWQMKRGPDGKYWGQGPDEFYGTPPRGKWICIEFMAQVNTPGKPDGLLAAWIDGKQVAFHRDVNWRTSEKLQLNAVWLMLYVTDRWTKHEVNTVWFDNVVAATSYIGPPVGFAKKAAAKPD